MPSMERPGTFESTPPSPLAPAAAGVPKELPTPRRAEGELALPLDPLDWLGPPPDEDFFGAAKLEPVIVV